MKNLKYLIFLLTPISLFACKSNDPKVSPSGGVINVTNAVVGGTTIVLRTNASVISSGNSVSNNGAAFLPIASEATNVNLTSSTNPPVTYYNQPLSVDNSTNYSLFLTGISPSAVESVLIKENYTRTYADSTCGVRFINLAPGSSPISVNIKGQSAGSEVTSLAYKAYGDFKKYPAKKVNTAILFEIRDATTGALLYPTNGNGYSLATPFFHNVTLCYRGTGTNVGIIVDNDY